MLQLYFELPLLKPPTLAGGQSEKCEQRMLCAWGQILLEETFQWNFPDLQQGMGCCHSSPFITDTASARWVSQRFGGWGRMVGEAPEEFRVTWKEGPSVVHRDTKSAHSPGSGRVWSFGYPFSQEKHINKSLLFGKSVNLTCSNKGWSSMTQSLMAHAPHMNSHPTLHFVHHSYITLIHILVSLAG